jgi:protein-tyrosine-phosphatase
MAEALLAAHLRELGVDARVRSAGTLAWEAPPTSEAVDAMTELGYDISGHQSTSLSAQIIEESDLILGMTRNHIGRVITFVPDAEDRAFLIGEFVRLAEQLGPPEEDEDLDSWFRRLAATRPHRKMVGRSRDEVADPLGEPLDSYRSTAARLDAELRRVAELLAQ